MSLERKDFRGKLNPHWHELMRAVADAEGVGDGEWIEALIVRELERRVHVANVICSAAARAGISGIDRESPGVATPTAQAHGVARCATCSANAPHINRI